MHKAKYYKFLLPILLVVTFLYGKYQGGFVSWFLFYSILTISVYILSIARLSLKDIKVKRVFHKSRLTAGDDIELEIEFWNRSILPYPYIFVIDNLPEKMKSIVDRKRFLIYPWFRPKSIVRYTIPKAIRGLHRWENIELVTGDVFGLIQIKKSIKLFGEAYVYPNSYPINRWISINERNMGVTFSQNRISEDTASVVGIREYHLGDRFNRIHWKQSAKVMQLMSKEFEWFVTNNFMFFLNQEKNSYSFTNQEHFEVAVELSASLVRYAIDQRFSAGIISEGVIRNAVHLSRGQEHVKHIFEVLAMAELDSEISFTNTVLNEVPHLQYGTTIILVTPLKDDNIYRLLGELTIRKLKVEVFVVDLEENSSRRIENINLQNNIKLHYISVSEWLANKFSGGIDID